MSIDNNETEKGQEQHLPEETIPDQVKFPASSSPLHPRRKRWLVIIISTVVMVLLLSLSIGAILFTQRAQQPVTPTPKPSTATAIVPTATTTAVPTAPPSGQWVQVLHDYRVFSLDAAPNHPNILYACSVPLGLPSDMAGVQTVLRSEDFGKNWQDIGSRAQMSRGCELTINPDNSNEIYVVSSSGSLTDPAVVSSVLKHTSDGGNTWETISPTISSLDPNVPTAWRAARLSFAGNRLYSVQSLPITPTPTPTTQGPSITSLTRLLMSADGGHTWNILDTQLAATGQFAGDYAVDPTNPTVLYELAGFPSIPGGPFPKLQLYKSVDSGQTWQPLLQQRVTLGPMEPIEILLGSENPNLIYLTNTQCSTSQTSQTSGGPLVQQGSGSFNFCVSKDGGKSWRTLISPDHLYSIGSGMIDQQGRLYAEAMLSGSVQDIWRYDPISDSWSKVAQTPLEGNIIACTSTSTKTIFWFMNATGQPVLYRYIL